MPRDMPDFWVTFIEKWLNRAKKIASTIDIMGNFCYAPFSLAVKAALQKNPFMNPSTYSPTIPVSLIGRRLFVITLVSAVLSVSLPTRAVATDADVFPVVASVQAPVAEEEVADYHFEVPQYTTVTVLRTYNYVPMTAYTSRPEETDDTPFITADGSHVRDGIIASNFLPFGTKVRIPELYGDKIFEVHDRMNKRYTYKIDIWMESLPEARKFGVRFAHVEIVRTETNK